MTIVEEARISNPPTRARCSIERRAGKISRCLFLGAVYLRRRERIGKVKIRIEGSKI
jgi:hypothetical protein